MKPRQRSDDHTQLAVPWLAVSLIAASALAYEILLIRLFAIIQWYHFGYMVISLALLGHGASGSFIFLFQRGLLKNYRRAFLLNGLLFAVSAPVCFLAAQQVPFNNLAMLWDARQWLLLALIYGLLLLPFFFAANCIGLTICRFAGAIPKVYACDLLGAALGAAGLVVSLYYVSPTAALVLISILGLCACAVASYQWLPRYQLHWLLLPLAVLLLNTPETWMQLRPAPYKPLSKALLLPQARVLETRSSPLGQLSVVESPLIPFRHAPGISINSLQAIPDQLAIFNDADEFSAITRFNGDLQSLAYLDDLTSALPYHLLDRPRVLRVGLGGGDGVLQANYGGAASIDVLNQNAQRAALLLERFDEYAGLYSLPVKPRIEQADARGFLARSAGTYDLIQLTVGNSGGLSSLLETYLYTAEAFALYWRRLSDKGLIAISGNIEIPPKSSLRMLATAIASLERAGKNPRRHLVLIRGWKTWTLIVARRALQSSGVQRIRSFCRQRAFDTAYYPGIEEGTSNRYNLLAQDYFYQAAQALLGSESEDFKRRYKFNIQPVTDDRPYFFQFFKWSMFVEWFSLRQRGGMALLDNGYPVLIATLLQALVFSVLLILLPLAVRRIDNSHSNSTMSLPGLFSYFTLVGLAFLMIEIAFIQRLILFLSTPALSIAIAIAAFLFFAGIGSLWAKHPIFCGRGGALPCVAVAAISLCYLLLLPALFTSLLGQALLVKIFIALLCIAPLAFFMGMPFPLGLDRVETREKTWLPWCWGINGCASVVSAVLSMLIASHFGFSATIALAATLYLLAYVSARNWPVAGD